MLTLLYVVVYVRQKLTNILFIFQEKCFCICSFFFQNKNIDCNWYLNNYIFFRLQWAWGVTVRKERSESTQNKNVFSFFVLVLQTIIYHIAYKNTRAICEAVLELLNYHTVYAFHTVYGRIILKTNNMSLYTLDICWNTNWNG